MPLHPHFYLFIYIFLDPAKILHYLICSHFMCVAIRHWSRFVILLKDSNLKLFSLFLVCILKNSNWSHFLLLYPIFSNSTRKIDIYLIVSDSCDLVLIALIGLWSIFVVYDNVDQAVILFWLFWLFVDWLDFFVKDPHSFWLTWFECAWLIRLGFDWFDWLVIVVYHYVNQCFDWFLIALITHWLA